MTALRLLSFIIVAILFQLAAGVGVLIWRRRATAIQPVQLDGMQLDKPSVGAWSGWRDFRVMRRSFEDAAKSQCSFELYPVDGAPLPPFRPGQYLTFLLPVYSRSEAGEGAVHSVIRCYSLSDRPDPTKYRITIKRVPSPAGRPDLPNGAASNHFHDRVQEGDVLKARAPSGRFFIDPDAAVPAVLIAGGIGIAPMMSILRWCLEAQPGRTVHLFYGVRNGTDHAFKDVLSELSQSHPFFKLHMVYSRPGPDDIQGRDYQHAGHIDANLLRISLPRGRHQFYVCGPPPMMQSLVPALREWGVEEDDIRFEAFGPASMQSAEPATNKPLAAPTIALEVRLLRSGRSLVWDGRDSNLLDFAQRQGVPVGSGCCSGNCGTCETKLVSGAVQYADKPGYEIADGHCLLCIGKPLSALVLDL